MGICNLIGYGLHVSPTSWKFGIVWLESAIFELGIDESVLLLVEWCS